MFMSYLMIAEVTIITNHATLKYQFEKKGAKLRLIWWVLVLQEFNLQIKDERRLENVVADHLFSMKNKGIEED